MTESSKIETTIRKRNLRELKPSPKNARYMLQHEFLRLAENIRQDGALTSTPLIYQDRILSGHHRIEAALYVGIEEADCMEIVSEITEDQQTAIQLSHNAIVGSDDKHVLQDMLDRLSDAEKAYATVDELDAVGGDDALVEQSMDVDEGLTTFVLIFAEDDAREVIKRIAKMKDQIGADTFLIAPDKLFSDFYQEMIRARTDLNLIDAGSALLHMLRQADSK